MSTTQTAHTWITNTNIHPNDQVFDQEGRMVADCKWTNFIHTEREQHARLIAAAPDLLAALKGMINNTGTDAIHWAIEHAQAAIAQAEGRASHATI